MTFAVVGADTKPAAATWVGPCEFRLDTPHISSKVLASQSVPVLRSHGQYYCTSEVLYVTAEVTLRRCVSGGQDPQTCAPIAEHAETDTLASGTINYNRSYWKILGTADSDPYPETGWYVATAVYEVCVFNGGAYPGTQQSSWAHWDQGQGKVDVVIKYLPPIIVPPSPSSGSAT